MQRIKRFLTRRNKVLATGVVLLVAASGVFAASAHEPWLVKSSDPRMVMPSDSDGVMVYRAALKAKGTKIMVSTESRWLWLISGRDTLVSAPIAIGMGNTFEFKGKTWKFETPRGKRIIRGKTDKPMWTVPEWHYLEKAADRGLEVGYLKAGERYLLEDNTVLDVRRDEAGVLQVGRVNNFGNW